jgi:hypothetical protein
MEPEANNLHVHAFSAFRRKVEPSNIAYEVVS